MTHRLYLNDDWLFTEQFEDSLMAPEYPENTLQPVRLPHTCKETPFHYFDESLYQMVSGYRRHLLIPADWQGKRILLTFEGAAHDSTVFCNGKKVGEHHCGYTAFTVDLTDSVLYGQDNLLCVRLDSRENLNVPPFGYVIDYMTYGGIYRDVRLEVNGTPVGLLWTDKALPGVPAKSYYTVQRYEEGDRIRLTASAEDLETVSSVTTIPAPFPLNSVHMERKPSDPGTLQFQINFTDKASTVNYYAVTVKERAKYWRDGDSRVYYDEEYTAYMDWNDEPLLKVSAGLDEILIGDYTYYEQLYIWSDEKIQGKNYTLRLNKTYISDYETSIQGEVYTNRKQYKVCLYSLSEEFYHYLKSMNEQVNNKLGESELAPVRPTYTNVENGFGLVGGCRMMQTEWMDGVKE